jgi:hypothetical protein
VPAFSKEQMPPMQSQALARPATIKALLILQIIPLLLLPPSSFSGSTQEWWLPGMLVMMVLAADFALLVRHTSAAWPWYLFSFAQGVNIISRIMMVWPHATANVSGQQSVDWTYLIFTLVSVLMSIFLLSYFEKRAVRTGLLRSPDRSGPVSRGA